MNSRSGSDSKIPPVPRANPSDAPWEAGEPKVMARERVDMLQMSPKADRSVYCP